MADTAPHAPVSFFLIVKGDREAAMASACAHDFEDAQYSGSSKEHRTSYLYVPYSPAREAGLNEWFCETRGSTGPFNPGELLYWSRSTTLY